RVLQIGANSNTAIYTPSTNTWVAGPVIPNSKGSDDAPGCILPNGHVIFIADTSSPNFTPPSQLFDFDPVANTIVQLPTPTSLTSILNNSAAFVFRMLALPNGDVLLSKSSNRQIWEFTPETGTTPAAAAPAVGGISVTGSAYTLSGTLLAGTSEGASYGDD